jgi:hypothetical protein
VETEYPENVSYMKPDRGQFVLEPGEAIQLSIPLDDNLTKILRIVGDEGLQQGYQNTNRISFLGSARYADRLGIERNLSVCRKYDNATRIFEPVSDTDREYSD